MNSSHKDNLISCKRAAADSHSCRYEYKQLTPEHNEGTGGEARCSPSTYSMSNAGVQVNFNTRYTRDKLSSGFTHGVYICFMLKPHDSAMASMLTVLVERRSSGSGSGSVVVQIEPWSRLEPLPCLITLPLAFHMAHRTPPHCMRSSLS